MISSLFKKNKMSSLINRNIVIILDNGHGRETPGKRSPKFEDGTQLFEWEFNRDIVNRIAAQLKNLNIPYEILVPEITDISLSERCRRANKIWSKTGKKCFVLSIHANAAGNGGWMNAQGWCIFTSKGKTKSDDIATYFWNSMKNKFPDRKMRLDTSDGDVDQESNFTILANTQCPAVLTENFFMDNKDDCKLIMSSIGRQKIADAHVEAIKKILQELY